MFWVRKKKVNTCIYLWTLVKSVYQKIYISQPTHMLWVLKRNNVKTDGEANIYNFMLKNLFI